MSSPLGILLLLGMMNPGPPRERKMVDRGFAVFMAVAALVIGLLCGGFGGWNEGDKRVREEAVNANVAEYKVDPKTGKVSFVWKD